jgi:hypothetical protein
MERFRKLAGARGITPVDLAEFDYAEYLQGSFLLEQSFPLCHSDASIPTKNIVYYGSSLCRPTAAVSRGFWSRGA